MKLKKATLETQRQNSEGDFQNENVQGYIPEGLPTIGIYRGSDYEGWYVIHIPTGMAYVLHLKYKRSCVEFLEWFIKTFGKKALMAKKEEQIMKRVKRVEHGIQLIRDKGRELR